MSPTRRSITDINRTLGQIERNERGFNITLSLSRWQGVSAERHWDELDSCSRCWTCHGRYPADLTRHNIVEICPSKYRTGKHVCRTWRTKRPAILTKLLSLMDPEAKRNLYGHYCIARNEIAISQYFQFDGTPGLCCCCQPLPGVRTVVLPEGFPPQFTVQDLQIAVQSSRVKKCAIKTNTTFLCITSQIQLCRG